MVPPRGADETTEFAFAQKEIIVIDKPGARACHEFSVVEHRGGFAPQIGDEATLGMFAGFPTAEHEQGGCLMIEQGALPPVKRPDGGNPRRGASELAAEMLKHPGRDDLDRIERAAGHLQKTDLEREGQPVQHPTPAPDGGKLVCAESEEMLDL